MYVIKHDTSGVIYPADRCSWIDSEISTYDYRIKSVKFYDGHDDNGSDLTDRCYLGFVHKTGRFVPITK